MRLILHIGLHKTGTTSLQMFFGESRELLRHQKIGFPWYEHGYQHGLVGSWFNLPEKYMYTSNPVDYWKKLRSEFSDCDTVVISSEELSRQIPFSVDFEQLFNFVHEFDVIDVVIVLRHQIDYMQSIFLEISKFSNRGRFDLVLPEWVDQMHADGLLLNYLALINNIFTNGDFSNLILLDYNNLSNSSKGLIPQFFSETNIIMPESCISSANILKVNESGDPLSVLICYALTNQTPPSVTQLASSRMILDKYFGPKKSTLYTRTELTWLRNRFKEINCELEKSYKKFNIDFRFPSDRIADDFIFREDISTKIEREILDYIA
jgi:hypothetical protein